MEILSRVGNTYLVSSCVVCSTSFNAFTLGTAYSIPYDSLIHVSQFLVSCLQLSIAALTRVIIPSLHYHGVDVQSARMDVYSLHVPRIRAAFQLFFHVRVRTEKFKSLKILFK